MSQENMRAIFNLAGIVMPALLIDGEVVGKWKKKKKKLSVTMFKAVTQQEKNIVADFAGTLWNDIASVSYDE